MSGRVSTLKDRTYVQVGLTSSNERLPEPVSGASVYVNDDMGNVFYLFEKSPGLYSTNSIGIPGRTYFATVQYRDQFYQSTPEIMPEYASHDSISYSFRRESVSDLEGVIRAETMVDLFAQGSSSPKDEPIIRWEIEEVYVILPTQPPGGFLPPKLPCYITQNADPQRIVMINRTNFQSSEIKDHLIASRPIDQSFHTRHYFNVYHSSITRETYDYWSKVDIVANQNGSIFAQPPAEIIGNIRNIKNENEKVMGYFQTAHETLYRFYLVQADLPFPLPLYCEFAEWRRDYPSECADCILVRNSSYERPEWF